MADLNQFTNLAGEFYVLSILNRLHIESYLTLGNSKGVDIVCYHNDKRFNVEVKTVMQYPWLIGTKDPTTGWQGKHFKKFYIFVKIGDYRKSFKLENPEVYIIPEEDIVEKKMFLETGKGFVLDGPTTPERVKGGKHKTKEERISYSFELGKYKDKWNLLTSD